MKLLLTIVIATIIICQAASYPGPVQQCIQDYRTCVGGHGLFVGCRTSQDRLLYEEMYSKSGTTLIVHDKTIKYPGGLNRNENITAIQIEDGFCNNQGGTAEITYKGVGFTEVKIKLKSKRGKAVDFHVKIYGH